MADNSDLEQRLMAIVNICQLLFDLLGHQADAAARGVHALRTVLEDKGLLDGDEWNSALQRVDGEHPDTVRARP